MKKILAGFGVAALLLWAADARAQNQPDESIAGSLPYNRIPLSSHLPNSYLKIAFPLPESEANISGGLPRNWLHVAMELPFRDGRQIAGFEPNSFLKIAGNLPESGEDNIAKFWVSHRLNVVDFLPQSYLKIGGQYPSAKED